MSKWIVDIHGDIEGDYELIEKYKEPKTGHWIDDGQYAEGHSEHACRCSKCGYTYIGYTDKYKECPNCGSKMQEVEE